MAADFPPLTLLHNGSGVFMDLLTQWDVYSSDHSSQSMSHSFSNLPGESPAFLFINLLLQELWNTVRSGS